MLIRRTNFSFSPATARDFFVDNNLDRRNIKKCWHVKSPPPEVIGGSRCTCPCHNGFLPQKDGTLKLFGSFTRTTKTFVALL
ncbi:MAG TPA: hypothetical protein VMR73_01200, partial [Candidatus Paceibacterota bacterium]|nr:hypothetical protein [Candidatus Paceibacterota bacterium]